MPSMPELLERPAGARPVLQGNVAFALGAIHAGVHAADGYPGTPSTEVMEAWLEVPASIAAGWSVNEAVAVGVAMGHAIAGRDAIVTMKVPGLFQAADVVASAAASTALSGALVLFVATDHEPSSTQYLVDARPFLASVRIPVLEPRDHQDLYRSARIAADLSRRFSTPVAILCSAVLCHSEGVIVLEPARIVPPAASTARRGHVLLPSDALAAFHRAVQERIPGIAAWAAESELLDERPGETEYGIIACGEAAIVVREALALLDVRPPLLTLGVTHPLPLERLRAFARSVRSVHLFEDGERFVEGALRQEGVALSAKEHRPTVTNWTPDLVIDALSQRLALPPRGAAREASRPSVRRRPSICPGCPYRATSLAIQALKQRGLLDLVFGDIGCSTLLHFQGALDLNLCMGASESMRQGFVLGDGSLAMRTLSLIGDSSECHSGLDASRNAIFRDIPGVKVILDNRAIAMTGGQPSPTTRRIDSDHVAFDLARALEAEGARAVRVDAYDRDAVERVLELALRQAGDGAYTTVVIEGACIEVADRAGKRATRIEVDAELCLECGQCLVCPGIERIEDAAPAFNHLCTRCGDGRELCASLCPVQAIREVPRSVPPARIPRPAAHRPAAGDAASSGDAFPPAVRVAVCGVGGQGNLFLGKVLAQVARIAAPRSGNILKGEVHGMAQKGGSVFSTFACGDVHSPVFAAGSVDILVAMERGELLRPGMLDLLKPGGTLVVNDLALPPAGSDPGRHPSLAQVRSAAADRRLVVLDASSLPARNANAAMLGMLSALDPFDRVALDAWIEALTTLSPHAAIAEANLHAFHVGRREATPSAQPHSVVPVTPRA